MSLWTGQRCVLLSCRMTAAAARLDRLLGCERQFLEAGPAQEAAAPAAAGRSSCAFWIALHRGRSSARSGALMLPTREALERHHQSLAG